MRLVRIVAFGIIVGAVASAAYVVLFRLIARTFRGNFISVSVLELLAALVAGAVFIVLAYSATTLEPTIGVPAGRAVFVLAAFVPAIAARIIAEARRQRHL